MRYATSLLAACLLASSVQAQPETSLDSSAISRIKYTRLAELEKNQARLLGGKDASVQFNLIRLKNLSSGQTLRGVEVNVSKAKQRRVGGSIAFAAVGSLFGVSSSVTYRRIRESGYIFLRPEDVAEVVAFLNQVVGNLGRQQQERYKIWKVSIQEGFELGMRYDPDGLTLGASQDRPKWTFLVTASDATYQLSYQDGLDVIRTLSKWSDRLKEKK